jgi:hypothetical protein
MTELILPFVDALAYIIKFHPVWVGLFVFVMTWLSYLWAEGILTNRVKLKLAQEKTKQLEVFQKLSEKAQLQLLESFPGLDPNNPSDVDAAERAQNELEALDAG